MERMASPKSSRDNAFLVERSGDRPEEELLGIGGEVVGTETPNLPWGICWQDVSSSASATNFEIFLMQRPQHCRLSLSSRASASFMGQVTPACPKFTDIGFFDPFADTDEHKKSVTE